MDGTDPKLQAMAQRINARFAPPVLPTALPLNQGPPPIGSLAHSMNGPSSSGTIGVTPPVSLPPSQAQPQVGNMQDYFQQQTSEIVKNHEMNGGLVNLGEKPSKKKAIVRALVIAGVTFVVAFLLLVSIRPKFVMRKKKNEHGTDERKCNFSFFVCLALSVLLFFIIIVN